MLGKLKTFKIEELEGPFGFRREGQGRVVYLFNGKVNHDAIELVTDQQYKEESEDGEIDFSQYDPSILYTDTVGEIECDMFENDSIPLTYIIEKINSHDTPLNKLISFIKKEIIEKNIPLIFIDLHRKIIRQLGIDNFIDIVHEYKNLNMFVREYDHINDY